MHKMVPQKSLTFYFQGVWRGEGVVALVLGPYRLYISMYKVVGIHQERDSGGGRGGSRYPSWEGIKVDPNVAV